LQIQGDEAAPNKEIGMSLIQQQCPLQARAAATPKRGPSCQRIGEPVLSRLYTAKGEQSFPKGPKKQTESLQAKEAHGGKLQISQV